MRLATFSLVALSPVFAACSVFGGGDDGVFAIEPGQCFTAPAEVKAQVGDLDKVDCTKAHDLESFATLAFKPTSQEGIDASLYPGDENLANFAEGGCAKAFGQYVGISYLESSLFFTHLTPSPRSWQDGDRNVLCFVIDSGRPMKGSVKGSRK